MYLTKVLFGKKINDLIRRVLHLFMMNLSTYVSMSVIFDWYCRNIYEDETLRGLNICTYWTLYGIVISGNVKDV